MVKERSVREKRDWKEMESVEGNGLWHMTGNIIGVVAKCRFPDTGTLREIARKSECVSVCVCVVLRPSFINHALKTHNPLPPPAPPLLPELQNHSRHAFPRSCSCPRE